MDLAKADKLWRDAMETTAGSGDSDLAAELLSEFIKVSHFFLSPPSPCLAGSCAQFPH